MPRLDLHGTSLDVYPVLGRLLIRMKSVELVFTSLLGRVKDEDGHIGYRPYRRMLCRINERSRRKDENNIGFYRFFLHHVILHYVTRYSYVTTLYPSLGNCANQFSPLDYSTSVVGIKKGNLKQSQRE